MLTSSRMLAVPDIVNGIVTAFREAKLRLTVMVVVAVPSLTADDEVPNETSGAENSKAPISTVPLEIRANDCPRWSNCKPCAAKLLPALIAGLPTSRA